MNKFIQILLVIFFSLTSVAQEKLELPTDAFGVITMECIKSSGIHQQYEGAVEQLFVMLKQQFSSKNVPISVWSDLEKVKPVALQNVKIQMVQAYRSFFNKEDMNQMLSFYQSVEGKKMLADMNDLNEDDRKVIGDFFNTTTGQKMMISQDGLAKMISDISEKWSSQLYQSQMNALASKGFSL